MPGARRGGARDGLPWFGDGEIDTACARALAETELLPRSPEAIRIDRFIERQFNVTHEYEDLAPGVLGYTEFSLTGVSRIVVAAVLDSGSVVDRRRERSTLAHEAGHGILHAHLFVAGAHPELLTPTKAAPAVLCREEDVNATATRGRRHEYHANCAIGGLLLPKALVRQVAERYLTPTGPLGTAELPDDARDPLVEELVDVFDVNRPVARIRVDGMYPVAVRSQLML